MIDIDDLLLIAGVIVLLVVAFHLGLWIGIAFVGIILVAASAVLARIKAAQPNTRKVKN